MEKPNWKRARYYNLKLKVKSKNKSYIRIIQENSMEFQVQDVYFIYTWLLMHTKLNLAYSKRYIYYILLIYNMILLFWNLLQPFMIYDCVTMIVNVSCDMWPMCDTISYCVISC